MAYKALPDFRTMSPATRFEVARPAAQLFDAAGRALGVGDPIPEGMSPRRIRQLFELRRIRPVQNRNDINAPAVAGKGKRK